MRMKVAPLFLTAAMLGLLVSCAQPPRSSSSTSRVESTAPATAKRIAAAVRSNPPTLSSIVGGTANGKVPGVAEIEQFVHSGLMVLDDQGARRAVLAEGLPDTANGGWR